ncbi:MAG: c-type cytochrome [Flavihumibacter sp.]
MDSRRKPFDSRLDNIYPLLKDPNGHDNEVNIHGGWIANLDSAGQHWELYALGFRNPFDLAFNDAGDMFTYDSDMEWDIGTPWYRPTRICHVTSGSEFGWRPGTNKWSPVWPDNSPALLNIGQGSPTNVVYGGNSHFPEKYRRSVFAFDWSFGIIYSIQLTPEGSSYKATGEEFLSGAPLPLTDGVIGPDGALYFLTGGRRLESDLYRVYYADNKQHTAPLAPTELTAENKLRRQLESYHHAKAGGSLDEIWMALKHPDRYIRYAALLALEYHPVNEWENRLLAEKDPDIISMAAIAYAHHAKPGSQDKVFRLLGGMGIDRLPEDKQVNALRGIELLLARLGKPSPAVNDTLVAQLDALYPAKGGNELNRELGKLLVYLGAPDAVGKTMALLETAKDDTSDGQTTLTNSSDLIMRNPQFGMDIASTLSKLRPLQQTFYAVLLTQPATGWTDDLRTAYFKWYYETFGYRGGVSYMGFINDARKKALAQVPKPDFARYNVLSGDSIVQFAGTAMNKDLYRPKGPGRNWTLEEAVKVADSGIAQRSFDKGKGIFVATLCSSCHTMRGEGGVAGPDLTQLGSRFSYKDMLEAIIDPNKTISDQFGTTVFSLKTGSAVMGRIISQDAAKYVISQNPFAPQQTKEIRKSDVTGTRVSDVSPMLPGLINRLSAGELKDLLAYLRAGGNAQDTIFAAPKK